MKNSLFQFLKASLKASLIHSLKGMSLLSLLLLSACQTLSTKPELDNRTPYSIADTKYALLQQSVDALEQWRIDGVFSYADSQDSVATGKLLWEKRGGKDTIQLIGPIGLGTIKLISTSTESVLISGKQQLVQPDGDIEQLLFKAVGWKLPINELRYWLFGLPAPVNEGRYELDELGNLKTLEQGGWNIRFSTYQPVLKASKHNAAQKLEQHPRKVFSEHKKNGINIRLVAKKVTL